MDTQKLTKSTLAVKLSVSAIIYPWWTATGIFFEEQNKLSAVCLF